MASAAAKWAKLSREWARSGQTQGVFCERHGVDVRKFRWWRWYLGLARSASSRSAQAEAAVAPDFVPVRVMSGHGCGSAPHAPIESAIEVRGDRGWVVRLTGCVDVDLAARLILLLEAGQ